MEHAGGKARFVELPATVQLLPAIPAPDWNRFAGEHSGWFGRDLVEDYANPVKRQRLGRDYQVGRALMGAWFPDLHPRTVDFLALVALGHRLAAAALDSILVPKPPRSSLGASLRSSTRRQRWVRFSMPFGVLPRWRRLLRQGATSLYRWSVPRAKSEWTWTGCKALLLTAGVIRDKSESRTLTLPGWAEPKSVKCYLLTPEGRARLQPPTTPELPPDQWEAA